MSKSRGLEERKTEDYRGEGEKTQDGEGRGKTESTNQTKKNWERKEKLRKEKLGSEPTEEEARTQTKTGDFWDRKPEERTGAKPIEKPRKQGNNGASYAEKKNNPKGSGATPGNKRKQPPRYHLRRRPPLHR